ncbi:zinc-ribbon domain-containing protein [Sedimentitalea sp. JM2-8]|uniref:Zinc-ribbon domain-containing protein n=1 Tax=Sedimentitalea xiamensis TaxID=3050037 RepID=A0ABT7FEF6_9RHOB|nr:zinc-ribbon domain-containing protein [Sedimentitalea xiamensis]MDK3073368.1 zinc-ribbon domain-containing protein [Sedimentitalea xiamensis]
MRLTCPNCDAQYEVPDAAIPAEGREVQCSNCGNLWFHAHPDHPRQDTSGKLESVERNDAVRDDDPRDGPARGGDIAQTGEDVDEDEDDLEGAEEDDTLPPRRDIDPVVIEILRAEAEREVRLRAAEKSGATETAADPGPEPDDAAADGAESPPVDTRTKPGRDALPELAGPEPDAPDDVSPNVPPALSAASGTGNAGGFARGFALVIAVASVLVLVYSWADRISESVPQAAPALDSYVANVNQMRVWLDSTLNTYLPK